ncbi:MAG: hypothetical protein LUC43_09590 [Burkholderiales bacterium]|nr:hypothetical protein [Burkholderiales bacterium]
MKISKLFLCGALLLSLVACNHPDFIKVGESYQQVMDQLGFPDSETKMPDGTIRVVYSQQPMGPQVYAFIFGPDGNLIKKEQILKQKFFIDNIKKGVMDQQDIDRMFGRYCEKRPNALSDSYSYMYRYVEQGMPMALYVDFDNKTGKVIDWATTIDPWSIKGDGGDKGDS